MIDLGLLVTDNDLWASVADDFECMQMIGDDMFPINGGCKTKHGITCLMAVVQLMVIATIVSLELFSCFKIHWR